MAEETVEQQVHDMLGKGYMMAFGDDPPASEPIIADPMKVQMMKERQFGEMQNCLLLLAREVDKLKEAE